MHPDTLVPIRKYMRPVDAHIDRALLQDAGFEAHVANEHTATAAPHFTLAGASVELQVRSEDLAAASELLQDQETVIEAEPAAAPLVCPHCGGTKLERERRFFSLFTFALLGGPPAAISRGKWICAACGEASEHPAA